MATVLGNVSPITSEYSDVVRRALDARQCALIVVDIQEKLLPPIVQKEQLLKNSQLLIRLAGILKIPTLMSTQYAKGLGETVSEIASIPSHTACSSVWELSKSQPRDRKSTRLNSSHAN